MDAAADDAAATAAAAAAAAAAALEYNMAGFREATERWYILSCALTLSGDKGLQPFSSPVGWMGPSSPPPAQAYSQAELEAEYERNQPSLNALVDACTERVPLLCTPDMAICLPLARLAAWTSADKWVRPLDGWQHPAEATSCEEMLRSLTVHLLEKWDVPPALHGALTYRDGSPVSEGAHRISKAFLHVHAEVGRGASVLDGMRAAVAPSITKTIAKHFVQLPAGRIGEGAPARIDRIDALAAQRDGHVSRLGTAHFVELDVLMALHARDRVPRRLAVAHGDDAGRLARAIRHPRPPPRRPLGNA
jgi:hypothetical protein